MNVPQMTKVLQGDASAATLSATDQFRRRAIYAVSHREGIPVMEAMQVFSGTPQRFRDMVEYGIIPRNVFNQFEQLRKGFPVYSMDFYDVARTYARIVARQSHLEPALRKVSLEAEAKLPPNLRLELKKRIEHGILRIPTPTDRLIASAFAPIDTFVRTITGGRVEPGPRGAESAFRSVYQGLALWDIGFNPSPIKKHFAADMMSIYAELGERSTMVGFTQSLGSRRLREFARTVGNVRERLPDIELFDDFLPAAQRGLRKLYSRTHRAAFFAYQKIDLLNQYTAWLGAYDKASRLGPQLKPVAELIGKGMTPEQAVIEYANNITRYTVPRQTPLDIPGLMTSTIGKLAFQFSSKKMQRGELIWDELRRAMKGEFGPFGRTLVGTAILTGLPLDELFAKKTGLDPERLPFYDVMGKLGFGMRKVLHSVFPHLGPGLQIAADIARFQHDPTRLFTDLTGIKVGDVAFAGRDIQAPGPVPIPLGLRSAFRLGQELREGKLRSQYGESVAPITTPEAWAHYLGFDTPFAVKATAEFANAVHQYHETLRDASREISVAYYSTVMRDSDWSKFVDQIAVIQGRYPDVTITNELIRSAITRDVVDRATRLQQRAPRGFLGRRLTGGAQ